MQQVNDIRVVLLHGIHSKEGDNNMRSLLPYIRRDLPGVTVEIFEYGFMGFWQARWQNNKVAQDFADYLSERPTGVIAHSNGGAIGYLATTKFLADPQFIVNINPALDRWRIAPVPWVMTIHSPHDRWVNFSQWLPGHVWGDQGRVGYKGRRQNNLNVDAWTQPEPMRYKGHCGLFDKSRISEWSHFITDYIVGKMLP
jgi:hypothetical protein